MSETIEARFKRYQDNNPQVYEWFKKFMQEAVDAGMTKVGARLIINRIRWEVAIKTVDFSDEGGRCFKISDSYIAWYTRRYIAEFPERASMFNLRILRVA